MTTDAATVAHLLRQIEAAGRDLETTPAGGVGLTEGRYISPGVMWHLRAHAASLARVAAAVDARIADLRRLVARPQDFETPRDRCP